MKSIYELDFMEEITLPKTRDDGKTEIVRRVPNGWIFTTIMFFNVNPLPSVTTVFVPLHNEFKAKTEYRGSDPSIIV